MRKVFLLTGGWLLLIVGVVLTPAPVPIPLIGVVPLLAGCAILSRHSRVFRRGLQYLRHRVRFISRFIEHFGSRSTSHVRVMVRRTDPRALVRHARRRENA